MNQEQCGKCHSRTEAVLYRVSCGKHHYEWLCKNCIKELEK